MQHDAFGGSLSSLCAIDSSPDISNVKIQESRHIMTHIRRKFKPAGSKRQQLTQEDAVEIFAMRPKNNGKKNSKRGSMLKCKVIGPEFGVSPKTIRDIWRGRTWTEATKNLWTSEDTPPNETKPTKTKCRSRGPCTDYLRQPIKTEKVGKDATSSFVTGCEMPGSLNDGIPHWHHDPRSHSKDPAMLHIIDNLHNGWSPSSIDLRHPFAPPLQISLPAPPRPQFPPLAFPPLQPPPYMPPAQQRLPPAVAAL